MSQKSSPAPLDPSLAALIQAAVIQAAAEARQFGRCDQLKEFYQKQSAAVKAAICRQVKDEVLALLTVADPEGAGEVLVLKYQKKFEKLAERIGLLEGDREDLVQLAWSHIFNKALRNYDPSKASFQAWVSIVAPRAMRMGIQHRTKLPPRDFYQAKLFWLIHDDILEKPEGALSFKTISEAYNELMDDLCKERCQNSAPASSASPEIIREMNDFLNYRQKAFRDKNSRKPSAEDLYADVKTTESKVKNRMEKLALLHLGGGEQIEDVPASDDPYKEIDNDDARRLIGRALESLLTSGNEGDRSIR